MGLAEIAALAATYLIPLYITNASALVFGGKHRLDFGKKIAGRPVFGGGKTFEGTIGGFCAGMVAGLVIAILPTVYAGEVDWNFVFFGAFLCAGGLAGDIAASFIKRRLGMEKGRPVFLLDQLDFIAGGLAFTLWLKVPPPEITLVLVALTLVMHKFANYVAFRLRMKSVPW